MGARAVLDTSPDRIAEELAESGLVEMPRFASEDLVLALRAESDADLAKGAFGPARVGRGPQRRLDPDTRGDLIRWFDPAAPTPPQTELLRRVEEIRLALNRRLFLGLFDYEACQARYPVGARYRRHRDRFTREGRRLLTLVTYLNDDWTEADGGQLRIHLPERRFLDVLPTAGKAMIFFSDRFPHEVLPTRRERLSVSGWYRGRP